MGEVAKVAVVDYGTGNLTSLVRALEHLGAEVDRITEPNAEKAYDLACLPGVGAFPNAMREINARGWADWTRQWASSGKPLLGICLGMQLLFDHSSELDGAEGLGLIPGGVTELDAGGERLPHIGWSEITWTTENPLSVGLETGAAMYHVHSFVSRPLDSHMQLATADHGETFTTAAWNGSNVFGVQFHPEKSSEDGLRLLSNFLALAKV